MADSKMQFLPFSAINMFMRPDYRLDVIKKVFSTISGSPDDVKAKFNRFVKQLITVPGFRNSVQAPMPLRMKPYISAFEKSSDLAAFTLEVWFRTNEEISSKVFDLLQSRGWDLYPIDMDRTKLPGFMVAWPKDESFEAVIKAFRELYPDDKTSDDDVSLVAVWLSTRLPYQDQDDVEETTKN